MAQKKLSRASKNRVDGIMQRLAAVQIAAHSISEEQITELMRRDAIPFRPDGYSTNSMPEHTSGGTFSSRTETVALQEAHRTNELRRVVRHLEKLAMHADVALNEFVNTLNYAHQVDEEIKSPVTTTPCLICEELPAEVSGYCRKDYDNWRNYGQPDRELWKMFCHQTTKKLEDGSHETVVMVPDCPPPTTEARRGPWAAK